MANLLLLLKRGPMAKPPPPPAARYGPSNTTVATVQLAAASTETPAQRLARVRAAAAAASRAAAVARTTHVAPRVVAPAPVHAAPIAVAPPPVLPAYLYHAAPHSAALLISTSALQPRSGPADALYLCMSGTLQGATTLQRRASDIVFRVSRNNLTAARWSKHGAGMEEWRGTETIAPADLEWRRYIGGGAWQNVGTNPTT